MARPLSSVRAPLAGRVVYPFGRPQRLGRIVRKCRDGKAVMVWWSGYEEPILEEVIGLMDYEALVIDTEKLAKNHRKAFEKALKDISSEQP